MPQKDIVIPFIKIKDRSVFSLDELYKLMFRWFESRNYDFQEREYRDEDMGGGKKHLEIVWYAERKIDDYFKFIIEINFLIVGLEDTEVERDGVMVKTDKGEIEMKIKAYILKDYDKKWEKNPVMRFFREIYDKKLVKSRIEGYEGELYEETYRLLNDVKSFLNLHRF